MKSWLMSPFQFPPREDGQVGPLMYMVDEEENEEEEDKDEEEECMWISFDILKNSEHNFQTDFHINHLCLSWSLPSGPDITKVIVT